MHTDATPSHHDVVVVGARCAGAATAMLLARQGLDVVAVDRARFPSDTLSTHSIARGGVVQLHRWGLLDEVLASGAPPIREVSFHVDDEVIRKPIKLAGGVDHLVAPRRDLMDDILFRAAARDGADMRTGITVTDLTRDPDGRVSGLVGRDQEGSPVDLRARFVVGADGLRSRVAKAVDAPVLEQRHAEGACFYAYFDGVDFTGTEFHLSDRAFIGLFPTHFGAANVWVAGPARVLEALRGPGRERAFRRLIDEIAPDLGRRVLKARQTTPVRGFAGMPNQLRQPVGDGWALVGDAGYFRDAVTGHGMTDAFRDAELLATALGEAITDAKGEREALHGYHARRDEMVAELFEITWRLALYPPVTEFVELQKRLSRRIEIEAEILAALPALERAPAHAA